MLVALDPNKVMLVGVTWKRVLDPMKLMLVALLLVKDIPDGLMFNVVLDANKLIELAVLPPSCTLDPNTNLALDPMIEILVAFEPTSAILLLLMIKPVLDPKIAISVALDPAKMTELDPSWNEESFPR